MGLSICQLILTSESGGCINSSLDYFKHIQEYYSSYVDQKSGGNYCTWFCLVYTGDQLADELCGLLGWEALELVEEVVHKRWSCELI